MKKLLFAFSVLLLGRTAKAQVEAAHLFSKGFSTTGFGIFLHTGIAVSKGDEISAEFAFYYFQPEQYHMALAPLLLGYRHSLDGSGTRWYLEPLVGYTFGGTDIQKTDAGGNPLYTASGAEVDQKITGFTAAMGVGYAIPSARLPLNIGLRYEHIFVQAGDPSQNMLSLRLSYSLMLGRRLSGK